MSLGKSSKKLLPFKSMSNFDGVFEFSTFVEFEFNSSWEEYLNYLDYVKNINQKIG